MKLITSTLALTMLAVPAVAGSADPAPADPVVTQAAPSFASGRDWTGAYGGLSLGYGDFEGGAGQNGDGAIGGLFAGYDWDLGDWVVGGAVEYQGLDANFAGADGVEDLARLKFRAGYDLGDTLVYGALGASSADIDLGAGSTSEEGYFVGVGAERFITDTLTLGGELTYDRFENVGAANTDVDGVSATARLAFRF